MKWQLWKTIVLCLSGFSTATFALLSDRTQPVYIEADRAVVKKEAERTTLTGNVKIIQGTMTLTGNVAHIHASKGKITTLTLFGNKEKQVFFKQMQENDQGEIKAWADVLTYNYEDAIVQLNRRAQVRRHGEQLSGDSLEYNLKSRAATAKSGHGQRVHIMLDPHHSALIEKKKGQP